MYLRVVLCSFLLYRSCVRHEVGAGVQIPVFTVAILAQGTNRGDALCAALLLNRVRSILRHVIYTFFFSFGSFSHSTLHLHFAGRYPPKMILILFYITSYDEIFCWFGLCLVVGTTRVVPMGTIRVVSIFNATYAT